jgi:hypothetical protein
MDMKTQFKKYTLNASIVFIMILAFAYISTYIHELGHAIMIVLSGGNILDLTVNSPLTFDGISGYVLTNIQYSVPIVIGGVLATSVIAVVLCFTARRTVLSYLMLCLSACTLYNAAYALSGSNDITWLVRYSWWSALVCLGIVLVNIYVAQQGLNDMVDDLKDQRTYNKLEGFLDISKLYNWPLFKKLHNEI